MQMGLLLVCVVLVEVDPAQNSCTSTWCTLAFMTRSILLILTATMCSSTSKLKC